MPASNPTYGKTLGRKTSYGQRRVPLLFFSFLAAVGGGLSHCIAVERVCWFAVNLAFALQGLAHFHLFFQTRSAWRYQPYIQRSNQAELHYYWLCNLCFFGQITIRLTYSFRLCVDCNVGAPRGIAHCILRKSRRSTHKLRLQGPQSLYVTSNRCLLHDSAHQRHRQA